jgi:hypothetical protein
MESKDSTIVEPNAEIDTHPARLSIDVYDLRSFPRTDMKSVSE